MDFVAVSWLFLELGLAAWNEPTERRWLGKRGVCVLGDPIYGVPYGRDRWALLFVATLAVQQGRRIRGNLSELPAMFGLSWRRPIVRERFCRLVHSAYLRTEHAHCFAHECGAATRIDIADGVSLCDQTGNFTVLLSERFFAEIKRGILVPKDVIGRIPAQPATLDQLLLEALLLADGYAQALPCDGPGSLSEWLGGALSRAKRVSEARQRQWQILRAWPDNPFGVSSDAALSYDPVRGARPRFTRLSEWMARANQADSQLGAPFASAAVSGPDATASPLAPSAALTHGGRDSGSVPSVCAPGRAQQERSTEPLPSSRDTGLGGDPGRASGRIRARLTVAQHLADQPALCDESFKGGLEDGCALSAPSDDNLSPQVEIV